MIQVYVENSHGIIEGLDYEKSRAFGDSLSTEVEYQGLRIKFVPTRFALDLIVSEYGRDVFHPGCRFAWASFYKDKPTQEVEFEWVTQPYDHQREWFGIMKDMPYFSLEWEMGLGKSKTILDVCQWAYAKGELDALLVVTLNGVHRKWVEKEVPAHFPKDMADAVFWNTGRVDAGMWTGTSRNRTSIVESEKFAIAAINFESVHRKKGLKFCERFLRSRKCAIVVDESQYIKTPGAAVTKALLNKLKKLADRRWITSGTMSTGSTLDPWAQYSFLDSNIVNNMKFHQWKAEFAIEEQVGDLTFETWEYNQLLKTSTKVLKPVMTVTGFKNEEALCKMLDPFRSRLLKTDCLDLPPKVYRMRSFQMTENMHRAYMQMSKQFLVDIKGGQTMTATMAMTKLVRLQQIACGYVVPDDADPLDDSIPGIALDDKNPRIQALMEELEKVRNKAIIWSYARYSLQEIAAALRLGYGEHSVVEYHGGVSAEQKAKNLNLFKEDHVKWFLGNPMSAGVGLDLVEADNMAYYNNSYNLGLRLQSEDRFHRIGQEAESCTITDFEALGTVDRPMLRTLKEKRGVSAKISGDILSSWLTESI